MILWKIERHEGVRVGDNNINNLRYADDTVLIADLEEKPAKYPYRSQLKVKTKDFN